VVVQDSSTAYSHGYTDSAERHIPAVEHEGTPAEVERLADLVRGARSVVALTGAGISVPSGIPDFRGRAGTQKGLWERVDPMEVAHIDAFRGPTPLDDIARVRLYGDVVEELTGLLDSVGLS